MNYEKKYNELVNAIKILKETNPSDEGIHNWVNDNVPELAESENEDFYIDDSYNRIKRYLGIALMDYLDNNCPEGKMCLSNMECADIDKAFDEQDWSKIERYIRKYTQKD